MTGGGGMELPIYDGGEKVGTLTVRREGLYAVFRAELPLRDGLQRLWLCGETGSVCLGLPEPRGGRLRLEKRLSRAACAALPHPPLRVSLQNAPPSPAPAALSAPPRERGARSVLLFGKRFVVFRS